MKFTIRTVALALALVPAAAFAQASHQPMTHQQVMDQLTQLRQAGYRPNNIHYPADIQAAEARVASRGGSTMTPQTGYGGTPDEGMQSGHSGQTGYQPMTHSGWRTMYAHH
ncbi:MAG: DUF4148 domain-containing protein [Trinickia sp.]|uniref:DUF4148 domain-containing protein n=1 Tax=Trinickia sp. TaxID=2571163 RepID=UPI003F7EFE1B